MDTKEKDSNWNLSKISKKTTLTLVWQNSNFSLLPQKKQPSEPFSGATQSSSSANTDHIATRKDIPSSKILLEEAIEMCWTS